jgi:hypothetical protein
MNTTRERAWKADVQTAGRGGADEEKERERYIEGEECESVVSDSHSTKIPATLVGSSRTCCNQRGCTAFEPRANSIQPVHQLGMLAGKGTHLQLVHLPAPSEVAGAGGIAGRHLHHRHRRPTARCRGLHHSVETAPSSPDPSALTTKLYLALLQARDPMQALLMLDSHSPSAFSNTARCGCTAPGGGTVVLDIPDRGWSWSSESEVEV